MGPLPLVTPVSRVEAGFFGGAGFYLRVSIFGAVALGALGLLALRLWSLQVLQGPHYARLAQRQTFRLVDFPSARGPIVDSRGRLLAGTDGRIVLTADAPALGSLDARGRWQPNPRGRFLLRRVARLTGVPVPLLVRRIQSALVRSPFAPAVVVPSLPRDLATYIDERAPVYPDFHVAALPQRSYPQGALGSEFLGLLGEVSAAQLKDPSHRGQRAGEVIGQSGVEASYDRLLNGGFQRARVRVDSLGRTIGPLRLVGLQGSRPALELTIDARLQRVAEQAITDGIQFAHLAGHGDADAGAAVVMSPRDGSIYALASYPDFNQIAAARDTGYLGRLLRAADPSLPLVDRATQGLYPTGSTFKPIVAEAALSAGLINRYSILQCTGSLLVGNIVFHNVEPGINAPMNLEQALGQSCDTWFYRLGTQFYWRQQQTGSLAMQNWARRLGLGHPTGLDIPGESAGVVPTPAWLKRTFKDPAEQIWYEGQSVNLSIGQGYLAVTPLQVAIAYSTLANGGTVVRPHVGRAVLDGSGRVVRRLRFRPRARLHLTDVSAIRDGLYAATHAAFGTSSAVFGDFPVPVAGKTGTAQTPSGSDHSWYASWAPSNDPRVVVVVLIEHGGFGVEAAAPAAKEIYSAFFHVKTRARARP